VNSVKDNLAMVRDRIGEAAAKVNRDPSSIKLVAVSKLKPVDVIREAYEAGQKIFGENYAQDMALKAKELADCAIDWHFIGHLQTNKARLIAPLAAMVETVDSVKLAKELNKRTDKQIDILIEVNIGGEESKSGASQEQLPALIDGLAAFDKLNLRGLMIIPPYSEDPEASRPHFRRLRKMLIQINEQKLTAEPLTELSMGMSHDYHIAIEEGATIVRVGTAIFGERM